ncbi:MULTISPECIES: thiol peroxidase [unclassified Guyparkeria]|uniref:thiol peroxidase n=1 Tax=unclassified Guyparkeria TaxID=2626246 RepID=UPI0007337935|nr:MULTISPECIES: thiol peroxidase [unclassified Guyparkeria]KTG17934.1 peroxidase [Guyparkeria sp. XI15]OAE89643.1 lipid hydroperoxide peroxidase [Guyparkeria sp. WRN-7]
MSQVTFKGTPVQVAGSLPAIGDKAPAFTLTGSDLSDKGLEAFAGQKKVLNIFPSLDTGTCAQSVREFNRRASELDNTAVLCISMDLPFAQARFCGAEGLDDVVMLSAFRHPEFLDDYGVRMTDGPLAGLAARTVVVLDADDTVRYVEQVGEIADEPDYEAALKAL